MHETFRAMPSSRLVPVTCRAMSICYLASGSTATPLHASCVGERVPQSPLKSSLFTHSPPGPPIFECSERTAMAHPCDFCLICDIACLIDLPPFDSLANSSRKLRMLALFV